MLNGVPAGRELPQNRWSGAGDNLTAGAGDNLTAGAGDNLTAGAGDNLTAGNWRFFRGCQDYVVQASPKAVPLRGQLRQTSSNKENRIFELVEVGEVEIRRHAKLLDEEKRETYDIRNPRIVQS